MNDKRTLIEAIQMYCEPSKNYYRLSSYGLKAMFEKLTGEYITNEEFVKAMKECGFEGKRVQHSRFYKFKVCIKRNSNIPSIYWGRYYA